ncbi:MAG TPA: DNA transfer protein, partial [Arsenophonus nasoniae]
SLASSTLHTGIANLASKRSGRYAIEKAIQEATKAVNAGASQTAIEAAERRFIKNKAVMKVLRDTLSSEEFQQMSRVGFVATISGMTKSNNNE